MILGFDCYHQNLCACAYVRACVLPWKQKCKGNSWSNTYYQYCVLLSCQHILHTPLSGSAVQETGACDVSVGNTGWIVAHIRCPPLYQGTLARCCGDSKFQYGMVLDANSQTKPLTSYPSLLELVLLTALSGDF